MKLKWLLLGAFIALAGCGTGSDMDENARVNAFMDEMYEYTLTTYPEAATYRGIPGQNHRWTDNSLESIALRQDKAKEFLAQLNEFDESKLSGATLLDYQLLKSNLEENIEGFQFPGEWMPMNQMGGPHQNIAQMFAIMRPTSAKDYEDIIARLKGVDKVINDTIVLMQKGLEAGVTPPRITLRDVGDQIKAQIVDDPMQSPMMQAFKGELAYVDEEKGKQLKQQAINAFEQTVIPSFKKLSQFWEEEYYPNTVEKTGISNLPNGKAWYAYNAKRRTTLDLTPDEIHEIGLSEVKRIRGEMEAIIEESGFEGSFEEFFEFLQTDDQFFHDSAEDLLMEYRDIAKRADAEMPKMFGKLPRLPYGVVPVPDYAEKSQTTAYYQGGSIEAGRPGLFYANKYNLRSRPRWEMEALTLHEGVPGHHHQIALAQELEGVHEMRKMVFFTAFVEGWGLYSESLGEEMGFYKDPYSKFGQLTYEMWRAIRLVVDTGMHVKGWSRQQAIDFFKENSPKPEHDITVEIDRYLVWPGQALAYKMGELKIKALRAEAETELGDQFDVRGFHDTVLKNGAVPLSMLEDQVKAWVETVKKGEV